MQRVRQYRDSRSGVPQIGDGERQKDNRLIARKSASLQSGSLEKMKTVTVSRPSRIMQRDEYVGCENGERSILDRKVLLRHIIWCLTLVSAFQGQAASQWWPS